MKWKTMMLIAVIAAALMLPAAGMADDSRGTTASVKFIDGVLEMEDAPMGELGMDIDFGEHELPSRAETYKAEDGDHTMRVSDARSVTKAWTLTAKLSDFTTTDSVTPQAFAGLITLNGGTSAAGAELSITDPVELMSADASATTVLDATAALGRGTFDVTWKMADITLDIDSAEYQNVQLADYTATLTWSLIAAP